MKIALERSLADLKKHDAELIAREKQIPNPINTYFEYTKSWFLEATPKEFQEFKTTNVLIAVCYLPPEQSERGTNEQAYFDQLLSVVYRHVDVDMCIFGGDINARVGNEQDFVDGIDDLCDRVVLDHDKNQHGDSFLDFLHTHSREVLKIPEQQIDNYLQICTPD